MAEVIAMDRRPAQAEASDRCDFSIAETERIA
jgi:hypothetical protein